MNTALYSLYSMKHGTTVLDQISQSGFSPGLAELVRSADGSIDPGFAAAIQSAPSMAFTTGDLKAALGLAGISGVAIAGENTLVMGLQKRLLAGAYASGSNHMTLTAATGLLVPRTLSAEEAGAASVSLEALFYEATGMANPVTVSLTAALADSPSIDNVYTLGPAYLDGSLLDSITGVSVDFGIQVGARFTDGTLYPSAVFIESRAPSISIRTRDAGQLASANLGLIGAGVVTTGAKVWFRQIEANAGPYSNASEKHVSITAADCRAAVNALDVGQGDDATAEVVLTPFYNDTAILAIASDAAIA